MRGKKHDRRKKEKPVERSDWADLEIPLGKRTKKYRLLEILPGALSYTMIILLFALSIISPALGSYYLLLIIAVTLVKAVGIVYRTIQGYNAAKRAEKVNWHERLVDLETPHERYEELLKYKCKEFAFNEHVENLKLLSVGKDLVLSESEVTVDDEPIFFPKPKEIYHAVIMVAYNEGLETLIPTVEAVRDGSFDNERIIFVFGYEERGGEAMVENAKVLKEKFKNDFFEFITVMHPKDLKDEIQGKGPNLNFAAGELLEFVKKKKIPLKNIIVTSLDSDNKMSKWYLDYVAYQFIVHPNRQHLSYQPVSLFTNNIWDAPAPMRIIAISNSFFNIISSMRSHTLKNFASHSQPLLALSEMGFWSKKTIVEDGHQYWRSLFFFKGNYEVLPIHVAIYQDAVMEETLIKTLKAQFVQLRRWDYGASDVAYVGVRLFSKDRKRIGEMPFLPLFAKFVRLLEGHVTLAAISPMVAFGGWVPKIINSRSKDLLTFNLPNTISLIQIFASVGLMTTILLSLKMLPPRPKEVKTPRILMILQWLLMPVVAIVYQSFAAFYSQTRLLTGNYMEKFDVTKKVVKTKKDTK
ncbi:hypothetical protein [Candidatus Nanosyncoccus nanoralicus]|uniref:Glycosyltransferase 2-like domain-containing protein n=1 Tax=Candidatus Nanosyncoccus nanoralicus TaxID=2171996 RepID=A0ABY0FJG2_9BACT|nr:hypothetical protein [Candidatus Nanosyncoccus nanoralicus]RYC73178.1 hypothetical protein G3KMM_00517 [Candidatus Nanosyncoccus nanoralicus]